MKTYLGDGVYADVDLTCGNVTLTTENGISVTNRIVLEPHVMLSLTEYLERLRMILTGKSELPSKVHDIGTEELADVRHSFVVHFVNRDGDQDARWSFRPRAIVEFLMRDYVKSVISLHEFPRPQGMARPQDRYLA